MRRRRYSRLTGSFFQIYAHMHSTTDGHTIDTTCCLPHIPWLNHQRRMDTRKQLSKKMKPLSSDLVAWIVARSMAYPYSRRFARTPIGPLPNFFEGKVLANFVTYPRFPRHLRFFLPPACVLTVETVSASRMQSPPRSCLQCVQ